MRGFYSSFISDLSPGPQSLDVKTYRDQHLKYAHRMDDRLTAFALFKDGKFALMAMEHGYSEEHTTEFLCDLYKFDLETGDVVASSAPAGHRTRITAVKILPDQSRVVSSSNDQ